ncbi:hypothetical protein QTA57_17945 [Fontisubflavum oceani]|uniref:hypothetical protein n=1 Tax=Fontisubflavum oceani TaxID=2978973 RepID=UPI0025B5AB7A|nr:hypothetical protein [Fontisubflavum oceani]WJY21582.1 hypothetical protein QTA57_17945 [Fontisubflavum oceani]
MERIEKFNFHSIRKLDYGLVRKTGGFAIDAKAGIIIVFWKEPNRSWTALKVPRDKIRSVHSRTVEAAQFVSGNGGAGILQGAHNAGAAMGTGLRNSLERRKAEKASGLVVAVASTAAPECFISIPEETDRVASLEAVQQFIETGQVDQKRMSFPYYMEGISHDPIGDQSKVWISENPDKVLARFLMNPWLNIGLMGLFGYGAYFLYVEMVNFQGFANALEGEKMLFWLASSVAVYGCVMLCIGTLKRRSHSS